MSFLHKCKPAEVESSVGPVTHLEYRKSGMRHMIEYVFQQTAEGTYILSRKEGWRDENVPQITVPASVAEELRNIAEEEHMRRYKSSYSPRERILDGWMWHLEIKYATGERVYSRGDNAYPDGEKGLNRLADYLENVWNTYKDAPPVSEKPAYTQDNVVYLKYDRSGMVAFPLELYIFEQDKDGIYWLTNGSNCHRSEARKAKVPATLHKAILDIIAKDGIKSYKSHYEPMFQVMDGEMWSLEIKFKEGKPVYSSGSNAGPSGDGLQNLSALFKRTWKEVEAKAEPYPLEN